MSKKIRVAVVGVGNCFSSLYQGLEHYKDTDPVNGAIPGVMRMRIGGYHPADIQIVAAFDVDRRKVGRPVGEAIFAAPNCARIFCKEVPDGQIVQMGPVLDGVPDLMKDYPEHLAFRVSNEEPVDVVSVLKSVKADILLNYMPVGSQKAVEHYAQCAIDANAAFLNCMPVFIASNPEWERKFIDAGLPLLGDDMKSQVGASIISQMIQELLFDRGAVIDYHGQYNQGSNTDFLVMTNQSRLASKKVSKENVIRSQNDLRGIPVKEGQLYAGPSVYVPKGSDEKVAFFDIRARGFGDFPITIDIRLSVQDSENSAGVVIDAIRYLKVARELGIVGALRGPSAWTQKSPPAQMTYEAAKAECEALADRNLSLITQRQLTKQGAIQYMEEQFRKGSTKHLERVKEYQKLLKD
jgi:myo-inositol-1-phosphate synthase